MISKINNQYTDFRDQFCISSNQVSIEGCFDTEKTARYAFQFSEEVLYELQQSLNKKHEKYEDRVITMDMLKEARKIAPVKVEVV